MKRDWIPILVIIVAVLYFMWPAISPPSGKIIYGGDLLTQFYYWKGYLADSIRSGTIPFWNPYLFSGTPFLAHPSIAAFYPLTLLFIIFPLNQAFSFFITVHLVISGLGMYWFCRKYCNQFGALVAATSFALSGYFAARIYAGHIDLLSTAVWIPWVLSLLFEIFSKGFSKRRFLGGVFSWSMLILAGYGAYLVYTTIFAVAFAIHCVVVVHLQPNNIVNSLRRVGWASCCLFVALLITAIQWLPTWELAKHSIRGSGLPYDLASWGSLPLSGLKLFFNPLNRVELNKIVFNLGGGPLPNPFDHFMGRILLMLAIAFIAYQVVLVIRKRPLKLTPLQKDIGFFTLISMIFLWIAFAHHAPLNLHKILYTLVPFYRYIRMPIQHLIIPVVLLSLLAGIAVSNIKHRLFQGTILLLIILESITFGKRFIFLTNLPTASYDQNLISYLQKEIKGTRLLPHYRVVSPVLSDFELNAAMKYQINTTSGYDPVILRNYYTYIEKNNGSVEDSLLQYNVEIPPITLSDNIISDLNIGYILEEKGRDTLSAQTNLYTNILKGDTYSLYKVENLRPRFTLTPTEENCNDINEGKVSIIKETINSISLATGNDCESRLITSDIYYPGWKTKIDGKPKTIVLSKNVFRTLNLPKGSHTVEFYYYPRIFIIGGVISVIGIMSCFIILKSSRT